MSFLNRLLGRDDETRESNRGADPRPAQWTEKAAQDPDAAAIERYRYLLRTSPPDALEQAHAEAFARLTPEQRRQVLEQLSEGVPSAERPAGDDPQALARAATRAEIRQPGFLERSFGGAPLGGGAGMGAVIGGSLLSSIAGAFIGSSVAHALFDDGVGGPDVVNNDHADEAGSDGTAAEETGTDDEISDSVGFEDPVGDVGGDFGDFDI